MSQIFDREEAIFTKALTLPEAERTSFVDAECGDDNVLRARVFSLLLAHEEAVTPQGPNLAQFGLLLDEKPGDRFGPYKLLTKIGEGGCGRVFMAEQDKPVRRRVALKVIKAGMDTREVIARFEAERQALALMDHPGICKVLDAGATTSGRPFFVMELVRGVPITRYCDEHQLTIAQRLELFVQVCHAVQHAHQKGIIHRDLKPSNILVAFQGGAAAPKIIDFGIAKATQGRLTEATLVTAFEQFLGTPAYMAPEQAEMNGLDIDTRTDVYSLGVLLYELLIGKPPFDPKALMVATHDELRRIIREVEPPRPSTQLTTFADAERALMARHRSVEPVKFRGLLHGDLDWIVMKALEKNRARRYDTPAALADDIARHLRHEPVTASPPGNLYKIGKFIRRHRAGVAAVAAVAFVLLAGIVASTWQAVRATRAERAADLERRKAVEGRKRADNLLGFMLGDLRNEVQKVGRLDLLSLVGTKATEYFSSSDPVDLSDEELIQQVKNLRQIGELQMSKAQYAEAMTTFETALSRAATALARHAGNGDIRFEYSQVQYAISTLYWYRGNRDLATEWMKRFRTSTEQLVQKDPENLAWRRADANGHQNLAILALEGGDTTAAREGLLKAWSIVEALSAKQPEALHLHSKLADLASWLGTTADRAGDYSEALRRYEERNARFLALLQREPENRAWSFALAEGLSLHAHVLANTGRLADSRRGLDEAKVLYERLAQRDPDNRDWQFALLKVRLREAVLDEAQGDATAATRTLGEVRPKLEALVKAEPRSRDFLGRLVIAWRLETMLQLAQGRNAEEAAQHAVECVQRLVEVSRVDDANLGECLHAYVIAGLAARDAGRADIATAHWRRGLELTSGRLDDTRHWRLLDPAARALAYLGRHEESRTLIRRLHDSGYRPLHVWPDTGRLQIPAQLRNKN